MSNLVKKSISILTKIVKYGTLIYPIVRLSIEIFSTNTTIDTDNTDF